MESKSFLPGLRLAPALLAALVGVAAALPAAGQVQPEAQVHPLQAEATALLADIDRIRVEYRALRDQKQGLEGDERLVLALQMRKDLLEIMRSVTKLVANVLRQGEEGLEASAFRKRTRTLLWDLNRSIPPFLDAMQADVAELRSQPREGDERATAELEESIHTLEEQIDEIFRFYLAHLDHLESFGLASRSARAELGRRLKERAAALSGRVELASQRLNEARKESEAGDAAREKTVRLAQENLDEAASSLWTICDLMDKLGLNTAAHRQTLIRATGEITTDVLDAEVVLGLIEEGVEASRRWLDRRGPAILGSLALFVGILVVFWVAGRVARRLVERMIGNSSNVSELARRVILSTVSRVVVGIGFFLALSQVGVNVTALLAGLGIVGFIIGFALQNTLGNFASGAMILMYRPFDVGDVIRTSVASGKVNHMNLVSTTVLTFDNQTLVVPNSKIWNDVIQNVTAQDTRRVDLSFGLSHDVDVPKVEALFAAILREHEAVLEDPAPVVKVHALTDSAVEFIVRPWCRTEDYWDLHWDLNRAVKLALDREAIAFGVPRREITNRVPEAAPPLRTTPTV